MSDVITLSNRVSGLEASPQFAPYSKVQIAVSDDTIIEVGNDTGRTLKISNPFGTQAMAENILSSLQGFQYQPYMASGALLDPSAEIGDGANIRGMYGGIYTRSLQFGRLMKADISAPQDEEINHEYAYESKEQREFSRQIGEVKASLIIANDRISASVSKTGGNASSFGWDLDSTSHTWYANGQEVMRVSASGLAVKGEVEATSGKIGNFTISAFAIWNSLSEFGGSQSSGVYVGTDGIQLGQRFKVDTFGNVTATRLAVDTLEIGGSLVSAATLNSRANSAYLSTTSGGYCYGGATGGYNFTRATDRSSGSYPSWFRSSYVYADSVRSSAIIDANSVKHQVYWRYMQLNGSYYYFLCGN